MNYPNCSAGIELLHNIDDRDINNVVNDSRRVEKGDLFVCIQGVSSDGHDFAAAALEKGAAAVVCQRDLGLENQVLVPIIDIRIGQNRREFLWESRPKTETDRCHRHKGENHGYKSDQGDPDPYRPEGRIDRYHPKRDRRRNHPHRKHHSRCHGVGTALRLYGGGRM